MLLVLFNGEDSHPLLCNSSIVFCHVNIHSILPAFNEFKSFVLDFHRLVVFGNAETWLCPKVTFNKISIMSYSVYRLNRDSRGDGDLVYVALSCRSGRRADLENSAVVGLNYVFCHI